MSKVQPTNGQLTIIDGEGNEKLCQILFTVESEEFNKKYVVFYPIEEMENEDEDKIELMAAIYQENEDGNGELFQIESDEEWAFLEDAVQQYEESYDEECCCEHDECCCEHDECNCEHDECCCHEEDCEDDCDENHCCCHHHE